MSIIQVFCIPGLGLSSKFFGNLSIQGSKITFLDWIEPKGWESLKDYALRISEPLSNVEGEVVLIGHSFGGVIAQEISTLRPVKHLILISSMVHPKEAPRRLKILAKSGLYRLISKELILLTFPFWARTHSYQTAELRTLFRDSVQRLSSHYFRWSLYRIATWSGIPKIVVPYLRIHGNKDVTFSHQRIDQADHLVAGGDHNMVYLRGEELSEIINETISILQRPYSRSS